MKTRAPINFKSILSKQSGKLFYAILDTQYVSSERCVKVCRSLLEGGADIVQLRAKQQDHRERCAIVEKIMPLFSAFETSLIINDDLELAQKYPSIGLHVGQNDCSVDEARETLGENRIIGLSTHSILQAKQAIHHRNLLTYFAVGPVFATPTKPMIAPVGLKLVKQVAQLKPPLAWFCIGGITRKNFQQVIAAGGPAVVSVSDLLKAEDISMAVQTFKEG